MSTSGVLKGCRVLLAAARAGTPKSSPTTTTAKQKPPSKPKPPSKSSPSGAQSGILKKFPVTSALQQVIGVPEASRGEVQKKIWEYIKLHNLQNPKNKKEILCDTKLKAVFAGKEVVGFLEVGKLLSPHFVKTA